MRPTTAKNWPKQRPELSTQFDVDCHKLARALMAVQARELTAMQQTKAGHVSIRNLNFLAQAVRKTQEIGRLALGEVVEASQLELNLRVIYDDKPPHDESETDFPD